MKRSVALLSVVFLLSTGALSQTPKTDREFAGLKGKVRGVIAQSAKLAGDGKPIVGTQQLSYNESYDTVWSEPQK